MVQESETEMTISQEEYDRLEALKRNHLMVLDVADDLYQALLERAYITDEDARDMTLLWVNGAIGGR